MFTVLLIFIISDIVGVPSAPNNGTPGSMAHILREPPLPERLEPSEGEYVLPDFPQEGDFEDRRQSSDCTCDNLEVS